MTFRLRNVALATAVVLVLTLGFVASRGAASGSSGGPAPQALQPVSPGHFDGDVRHIPQAGPLTVEERLSAKAPDTPAPGPSVADPVAQTTTTSTPAPSGTSFPGLDFNNWGAGWPPDTNGDVGPTYYVQTVNTSVGIFNKSTGALAAGFTFDALFSSASVKTGTPCDSSNQGDPVALYDPIADRWFVADLAWSNYTSGAMYECMAVSKTGNPVTGGWYFYAWPVESGGTLPDYPKLGLWPDGIYMSANDFSTTSGSFQHVQVWALNRTEMEAGADAHGVTFNLSSNSGGVTVFSLLPSNARAATGLPPVGAPNLFASIWGAYDIRAWKFHVDYTTPANSTFTGPTNVPIATFNVGPGNVPEQGGNNIDTLSYRLMMQNQYTNLGGHESLWLTHTVGSGGSPNVAEVRWYQLDVTGGTIAASPTQQSTWAPDSNNRFMPSLALDKNGDMAIGYSVSSSSMYPAIRYAGRLVTDAANTLGQSETTLIAGTGFQCCTFSNGATNTRWGDYSAMTLDPDGCTFWYTNEYYGNQPTTILQDDWLTRIGSFKFGSCSSGNTAPAISSFAPTSGPVGTSVTITGSNLTGATAVTFNGTSTAPTSVASTQVTATVPTGATSGLISVVTPGGTAYSANSFTVTGVSAPTVSSFSPTSGPVGTSVSITGTGFTGATSVTFGGTAQTSLTVVDDAHITAAVPTGAATGPIGVTTPGGTGTSVASFTVTTAPSGPTISSFSPGAGHVGTTVTILGSGFTGVTGVTFGGKAATTVNLVSDGQVNAVVPSGASTGLIGLTTPSGTAFSSKSFKVH